MKIFYSFILLPVLVFASNIDPLYDFDYARLGVKGIYLTGGAEVNLDNALYDKHGKKLYSSGGLRYSGRDIWVPIRAGYSFNKSFSSGFVIPFVSFLHKTKAAYGIPEEHESNTGIGNPWVWGKVISSVSDGFFIGPRFGVKIPIGAYTLEEQRSDFYNNSSVNLKATLGDKSWAFDIAVLYGARSNSSSFRMDGHLALRYSIKGRYKYDEYYTYSYPDWQTGEPVVVTATRKVVRDISPGMWLDFCFMPGIALGDDDIESYLCFNFSKMLTAYKSVTTTAGIAEPEVVTRGGSIFSVGVKFDYLIDYKNTLELKFIYDLVAYGGEKNEYLTSSEPMPAGMSVGIGYFGYIPM